MSAPKVIWTEHWPEDRKAVVAYRRDREMDDTKYIRADLVDQLRRYAVHENYCKAGRGKGPCTCGLTELLGEME